MLEGLEGFIHYAQHNQRLSAHTCKAYQTDLQQFIPFANEFGISAWHELNAASVRAFMASCMQEGLSARSIHRKVSSIRAFVRYARKTQLLSHDPLSGIQLPKMAKKLVQDIPSHDLWNLFQYFPWEEQEQGLRDKSLLLTLYTTGIRLSELISLNIRDIDFSRNTLSVTGKRNKVRLLPLHPELRDYLLELTNGKAASEPLFQLDSGKPLYPVFVNRLVNRYIKQFSDASKTSPHVLRHSFATHMLNNGAELLAIKDLLGHSGLNATQIYTKNSFEKLKSMHKLHPRK
jgi:integrase/recombinase XerC